MRGTITAFSDAFLWGAKDCKDGKPKRSTDPAYLRGYEAQGQLQALQKTIKGNMYDKRISRNR